MNSEQFAYWLQGAIELGGVREFTPAQTAIIRDHLALVFNKVTPARIVEEVTTRAPFNPPATTLPFPSPITWPGTGIDTTKPPVIMC